MFVVVANDAGNPPLSSTATVFVLLKISSHITTVFIYLQAWLAFSRCWSMTRHQTERLLWSRMMPGIPRCHQRLRSSFYWLAATISRLSSTRSALTVSVCLSVCLSVTMFI